MITFFVVLEGEEKCHFFSALGLYSFKCLTCIAEFSLVWLFLLLTKKALFKSLANFIVVLCEIP